MKPSSGPAPDWYHAQTLTERLASLRAAHGPVPHGDVNNALAERRMQRWQSQPPFESGDHFAQRLAMDGITEAEFLILLGEPMESVANRFPAPPTWLEELAPTLARSARYPTVALPEALSGQEMAHFVDVIAPLIQQARDRVRAGVQALAQEHAVLPFDPSTVEALFFAHLPEQLLVKLSRTLVLELNVARMAGELQGDTAEERFQSFLQRLREPGTALELLQEYPVLARQITICLNHWTAFALEFLQHLCSDWASIRTTFCPEDEPGVLVQVEGGAGDRHRRGRSVLIARFSSGFQLVYKPRSLAVDRHFQELLTWLDERGDHPCFRTLKLLDRESYGWVEFVVAQSCASTAEVQRFYERLGGFLALLYALEATDFHFENLIAAGEHPVLLDLEALFHPRIGAMDVQKADELASSAIGYSVLRIGLLPQRTWADAESVGMDVSGLGTVEGQLTARAVPSWSGAGTDEMRLDRKRMVMHGGRNRPTLNGTEIDVVSYTEAIAAGFTGIYHLLLQHREELLAEGGPIQRFAGDEVRVILRATQTYGILLRESFHPDVLRNALDRDRLFDRLWVGVPDGPYLLPVIAAEREDLQHGDIPIFTTRPASSALWTSAHQEIADFVDEPGMALVQRRLERLSAEDREQQLWFVRASMATLSTGADRPQWPTYRLAESPSVADRGRLLAAARAVGDRLEALALRGDQDVSWIGLTLAAKDQWTLVPLGIDLYDGLPGVALFLAHLGALTHDEQYTATARAAVTALRRQLEYLQSSMTSIGGFGGWGGVIYALTHLAALWDEPALRAEAEAVVERLPALIEQDEYLDVIGGAAGCIGSLLSLHRCAPSPRTLAAAIQCGDRLIASAQPMSHGIGWIQPQGGQKALTGFAHGAAGMAWALLELSALSGEARFRTAALQAMAYERSLFVPRAGNWPDLRDLGTLVPAENAGQTLFQVGWCHGAPGIGLARLRSLRLLDDAATRAEIDAALKTTLAQGFGHNHSLCHGDLGNLELLLQAGQVLDDPQWRTQADRLAAMILDSIGRLQWICGTSLGVESPGLMTGLAGTGYGLLRLADPARVPSVLVMEPPKRSV